MRCKVVCSCKQIVNENEVQLCFSVVYSGSEENKLFFKYTPGGQAYFNVVRPEIAEKFVVGKEYYIDFFAAE